MNCWRQMFNKQHTHVYCSSSSRKHFRIVQNDCTYNTSIVLVRNTKRLSRRFFVYILSFLKLEQLRGCLGYMYVSLVIYSEPLNDCLGYMCLSLYLFSELFKDCFQYPYLQLLLYLELFGECLHYSYLQVLLFLEPP